MKKSKSMYVNEILRLTRLLVQMKYDEDDFNRIKKLISENFTNISKIEKDEQERREERKREKEIKRLKQCF